MSTTTLEDVTINLCGPGRRLARSWYKSAGKPRRITSQHIVKVLRSRFDKSYPIPWNSVLGIICGLLTERQIKKIMEACRGKAKRQYSYRRFSAPPYSWIAKEFLWSLYPGDRIEVLEHVLSIKK